MPQSHVYHVVPGADGRWAARLEGDGKAHTFQSRDEALRRAQADASEHAPSQVVVHRADGSVEERLDWGAPVAVGPGARGETRGRRDHLRDASSETGERPAIRSRVTIAGHPVHPMLIAFPIGTLGLLPVSDLIYWVTRDFFWARMSWFLVIAGLITAGLAALVGLVDFVSIRAVRTNRVAWFHFLSNGSVAALTVVNVIFRASNRAAFIVPSGTILSLVTLGLLVLGGWYGGELAYRYRVGVIPEGRERAVRPVKT